MSRAIFGSPDQRHGTTCLFASRHACMIDQTPTCSSDKGYDHHAIFVAWQENPEGFVVHHPIGKRTNPPEPKTGRQRS